MTEIRELGEELKLVLSSRGRNLVDSFLPLLLFLVFYSLLGLNPALGVALASSALIALFRILRHESLLYSLGGTGGVVLAAVFAYTSSSGKGFFIPGLISGSITVLVCLVSVIANRPIAAWGSFLTRRWPLDWYWHPQVTPAYLEVSIGWAVAFALRLAVEFWLFQAGEINMLGATRIALGWPYTIILLVASYFYGMRRLRTLGGPSVEEFKEGKAPPWASQRRGF